MKHFISLAAASAAFMAAPAAAQEVTTDTYDGFYIGATLGGDFIDGARDDRLVFDTDGNGGFGDSVRTVTGADAFSPGFCSGIANGSRSATGCGDDDGALGYSVRLGFDKRVGNSSLVAGFLVEGEMSNATDYTTGFSTTPASYTFARELDKSIALRGRIGASPGDGRGLIYATGGFAYGQIDDEFITTNGVNSFDVVNGDKWQFGAQFGGGAEVMVAGGVTFGVEYLYSSYDDDDAFVAVGQGTAPATNPFVLRNGGTDLKTNAGDFDKHSVRATIGYRF
ncbi:outer membrane protein [Qipengyuania nanhaisediminis]|nr:outer membrane beta-barrel protein [Qipengyuania nanhaisediminis]